jgi:hypothetical protein
VAFSTKGGVGGRKSEERGSRPGIEQGKPLTGYRRLVDRLRDVERVVGWAVGEETFVQ